MQFPIYQIKNWYDLNIHAYKNRTGANQNKFHIDREREIALNIIYLRLKSINMVEKIDNNHNLSVYSFNPNYLFFPFQILQFFLFLLFFYAFELFILFLFWVKNIYIFFTQSVFLLVQNKREKKSNHYCLDVKYKERRKTVFFILSITDIQFVNYNLFLLLTYVYSLLLIHFLAHFY